MLPTPDFHHEVSRDTEVVHQNPLRMAPLHFPPSPRGRAAIDRMGAHHRAFSHSPQPTYLGGLGTNLIPHHSHSNLGFVGGPSCSYDEPIGHFIPYESATAMEDYLDASLMVAQYLDLPTHCASIHQDSLNRSHALSGSSASSPEATDTAPSSSPRAEIFSTQSSSGDLLPDASSIDISLYSILTLAHPFVLTCHQPPPALPRSAAARRSLARSTSPALCALSGPNTDPSELRLLIPFRKPVDFAVPTPPHPPVQRNYALRQRSIPLPRTHLDARASFTATSASLFRRRAPSMRTRPTSTHPLPPLAFAGCGIQLFLGAIRVRRAPPITYPYSVPVFRYRPLTERLSIFS
ncbi:hypothetical protein B0H17DRAFT_1208966 [Mycena rosella]|uniref:Uncharacterized protein n=1 Tax=Mycena rosella TaxID=1033263 RepID=A0AAD7CZP3_MYCRO|nr:hypothetical protein B0H17DRAFT_1208966 [Mycena rosella]